MKEEAALNGLGIYQIRRFQMSVANKWDNENVAKQLSPMS
jgi:hypothetical protein